MWISCRERLPKKPGSYPVYAPSADEESPLRTAAWFEPKGTGNEPGWKLLHPAWCEAITHWMEWPDNPTQ